ncbi:MAG TPA: pectinesterase family protein [Blastocatellia bacterium]|nr:pectinesterase family protein [Blastocatellia bacterium]
MSRASAYILLVMTACAGASFLTARADPVTADTEITVAADGTARFKSIQEAVMAAPTGTPDKPVIIRIKPGVYKELVYVQHEKRFVRMIGEDANRTILTYGLYAGIVGHDGKPIGTFRTPTVTIDADDFIVENITFENSAGPIGQALAVRVDGDRVTFRNCRFLGWQDTVFINRGRQYFEDCYIAGHVDFIFGGSTAFFQHCHIHCLKNGYITAASTPDNQKYGFVFSNCTITAEPGVKTYLGRPWRAFSSVVFLSTEMCDAIRPEGWHNWDQPEREATVRYGEYKSRGAGAAGPVRVKWSKVVSESEAKKLTVAEVLGGPDRWDPLNDSRTPMPQGSWPRCLGRHPVPASARIRTQWLDHSTGIS